MTVTQQPNLHGKVDGIVGWDPLVLQCRDCGTTHSDPDRAPAVVILTAGFKFHRCEGPTGVRRCPSCLTRVLTACTIRDHRRD